MIKFICQHSYRFHKSLFEINLYSVDQVSLDAPHFNLIMQSPLKFCPICADTLELTDTSGRERLSCPTGHWTHWDNPLPVLAAMVEIDGKIIMARNAAWPPKMFALITGFLERGESPSDGIAREVKEETNLDVFETRLIGVYEFIRKNELIIAYHVKAVGEIKLSEELAEHRLVPPEMLRPWPYGTGLAIADWMRARNLPIDFIESPVSSPHA
jgi:NADH pyrophosphatase NudC (nudix superfamily)